MAKKKVEDVVFELTQPIVLEAGCELVEVNYVKEGANWFLRIFIDKEEGITIDDCTMVSRKISVVLDEVDPINQSYFLEVSSPGINRLLKTEKDFLKFKGQIIKIKLYKALSGSKKITGILEGYKDKVIKVKDADEQIFEINLIDVASIRLSDL